VADFRPPNGVRVAPAPLYTRFEGVRRTVERFRTVVPDREYEEYAPPDGGVT